MTIERRIVIGCGYSTFPADSVYAVRVYDADLNELWKYNHGGTIRAVAMDSEGNVYVAGARVSNITTRKLDPDGNVVWSKDHGGTVMAIAVGSDGAVYTGGGVVSSVTTRSYAADGTPGWTANHGATIYSLSVDSSHNVYTAGNRFTASYPQGHIQKYNSSGTRQWTLDLGSSVDYIYGISADNSGNFYVTGYRDSGVTTRKYNSSRTQQWAVDDGGSISYNGQALALDSGAVYVGFSRNNSKSLRKRALSDGAEVWFADTGYTVNAIAVDADGDVYAGGSAASDYTLRRFGGSSGTLVDSVTTAQLIYAIAVTDITIPDQAGLPPGLPLPLALGMPFPTAAQRLTTGAPLSWALGIPDTVTPGPPVGDGQPVYAAYLGVSPPLKLPMASFQCQRRWNESTWLVMELAGLNAGLRTALLSAVGASVVVYAGFRTPRGLEATGEFLRAVITDVHLAREPHTSTARVTARIQAKLEPIQTRVMIGVFERQDEDGRRKIRCDVNPRLRPGDTVDAGAMNFVAHNIRYSISPHSAWMDVQEAPNG